MDLPKTFFMNIMLLEGTRMLPLKVRANGNSNLAKTRSSEVVATEVIRNITRGSGVCNRCYNNKTIFNVIFLEK